MEMKKIPSNFQSLICASTQIRTFKRAIEELLYNALDAGSTSIAIRVHIQDSFIQIIDNGCGIPNHDFNLLGQRYATSKLVDIHNLKPAPYKYGFQGQSLANIIEVSQSVKIVSRFGNESTILKSFYKGKEDKVNETNIRPSKGTTVEIKGFLFNLNIQRKAIDPLIELQDLKRFLNQLSLVHTNTSITLKDNSSNEMIFKLHKTKDIYQTLSTVFEINKSDIQEFKVEKNEYKVTGFIGKQNADHKFHWIYVNGKIVSSGKLYKIVNDKLSKMHSKKMQQRKVKTKKFFNDNEHIQCESDLPFYFIFITCPYNDYFASNTSKQSVLEFINWDQVTILLEKLIIFYSGEIVLKEVPKPAKIPVEQKGNVSNTREEVKKIIEKILGSSSKKLGVSQMKKGVKGKLIKRKTKKKPVNISISKIIQSKAKEHSPDKPVNAKTPEMNNNTENNLKLDEAVTLNNFNENEKKKKSNHKQISVKNNKVIKKFVPKGSKKIKKDPIVAKFQNETESVKKRRHIIAKKAEDLYKNTRTKKKIIINETVQYSNIIKNNKKYSVRKKIVIEKTISPNIRAVNTHNVYNEHRQTYKSSHDLLQTVLDNGTYTEKRKNTPNEFLGQPEESDWTSHYFSVRNEPAFEIPKLTYESHHYECDRRNNNPFEDFNTFKKTRNFHFITKESRDNFLVPENKRKFNKQNFKFSRQFNFNHFKKSDYKNRNIFSVNNKQYFQESSYTIEFSKDTKNEHFYTQNKEIISGIHNSNDYFNENKTYSLFDNDGNFEKESVHIYDTYTLDMGFSLPDCSLENDNFNLNILDKTYSLEMSNNDVYRTQLDSLINTQNNIVNKQTNMNLVFISNSEQSKNDRSKENIEPLDVCQAVLSGNEVLEEHLDVNFSNEINTVYNHGQDKDIISEHFENITNNSFQDNNQVTDEIIKEPYNVDKNVGDAIPSPVFTINRDQIRDINHSNILKKTENVKQETNIGDFHLKDRLRFIPKGMSQIFEKCQTKNNCVYNLSEDYYEETIYNNFATNVDINTEIFEPEVQNIKNLTTRDIQKVSTKLKKENASLTFNGESLKQARVLGQIDDKFIAAIMKDNSNEASDLLVLFDQHAVHERIRLEENLADYFQQDQWKSIVLENISLQFPKETILYLHNYKDKFSQFGLHWDIISSSEIMINAIPEAILGKTPREVKKVIKAVRKLITETIQSIKTQRGCVSLYPKPIMDLVFSEACRYAIKFGDHLSKSECMALISKLSKCQTPFQCAHGRPVMAVLLDVKSSNFEYKANTSKIHNFIKRRSQQS